MPPPARSMSDAGQPVSVSGLTRSDANRAVPVPRQVRATRIGTGPPAAPPAGTGTNGPPARATQVVRPPPGATLTSSRTRRAVPMGTGGPARTPAGEIENAYAEPPVISTPRRLVPALTARPGLAWPRAASGSTVATAA